MNLCNYQILVHFNSKFKEIHAILQINDVNFLLLFNCIFPFEKVTDSSFSCLVLKHYGYLLIKNGTYAFIAVDHM